MTVEIMKLELNETIDQDTWLLVPGSKATGTITLSFENTDELAKIVYQCHCAPKETTK